MSTRRTFVVVGANLCGLAAVQTLRQEGFDGRVVLVGEEPYLPYERPPLSKEFFRGESGFLDLFFHFGRWFQDNDIELEVSTRALALDLHEREVELSSDGRERFDALLLATGGRPRRTAQEGERVHYLRGVDDASRLRRRLEAGARLIVVGAGFIGAEVAASARALGIEVTMLETLGVPLERAIGEEMGRLYAQIHRDEGVELHTGQAVASVEEDAGGVVVRTAKDVFEGDLALIAVGIEPNVELAALAGVATGNGVVVDEFCRTSAPGVFAAGDVANHYHPLFGSRLRVEHYDNALKQGACAARNMLGLAQAYEHPHWFWSDQYDYNLQVAGIPMGWNETVVRGSIDDRSFACFYLKDGVIVAALGINRGKEVKRALKLISARARPDPKVLRDEEVDLRRLVA